MPKSVSPTTRDDSTDERKRKGKGKIVKTHLKGEMIEVLNNKCDSKGSK